MTDRDYSKWMRGIEDAPPSDLWRTIDGGHPNARFDPPPEHAKRWATIAVVGVVLLIGVGLPLKLLAPLGDGDKDEGLNVRGPAAASTPPGRVRSGPALVSVERHVLALRHEAGIAASDAEAATLLQAAAWLDQKAVPLHQGVSASEIAPVLSVGCAEPLPAVGPPSAGSFWLRPDGLHVRVDTNGFDKVAFFLGPPGFGDAYAIGGLDPGKVHEDVIDVEPGDLWVACHSGPWALKEVTTDQAVPVIVVEVDGGGVADTYAVCPLPEQLRPVADEVRRTRTQLRLLRTRLEGMDPSADAYPGLVALASNARSRIAYLEQQLDSWAQECP